MLGIFKYESRLGGGPIQTASSAKRTCRLSRSAVEYTATVLMPISLQVRIIRRAISPRLAINIFLNIVLNVQICGYANVQRAFKYANYLHIRTSAHLNIYIGPTKNNGWSY